MFPFFLFFYHLRTKKLNRILNKKVVRITNLLGQDIDEYYKGFVIILYSDGTTNKELK